MYLIVGLGNPGKEYEETRHNVGFRVIDRMCQDLGISLTKRRFQSRFTLTLFQGAKTILLCPVTFMNRSGRAIRECINYYDLETEKILVIHDDLDIPIGRVKVVRGGGAGGHKGISSIVRNLGSMDFPRVKIGIGRPRYEEDVTDYVLNPFYSDEKDVLENSLITAARACELFVTEGIGSTMNSINCQRPENRNASN